MMLRSYRAGKFDKLVAATTSTGKPNGLTFSIANHHPDKHADGAVVWRKKVRRGALLDAVAQVPACLVGIEACATAHYWAREISALGHEVRLMPPAYVKAYLRRQKNDAADAEAIFEAVRRPSMRFVPAKRAERQAVLVLHRSRANCLCASR